MSIKYILAVVLAFLLPLSYVAIYNAFCRAADKRAGRTFTTHADQAIALTK